MSNVPKREGEGECKSIQVERGCKTIQRAKEGQRERVREQERERRERKREKE